MDTGVIIEANQSQSILAQRKSLQAKPVWKDWRVQVGAAFGLVLMLTVVMVFQTNTGTIRVEILDPAVEVQVKGTNIVLKGTESQDVEVKAGKHTLTITRGDLSFETKAFQLEEEWSGRG